MVIPATARAIIAMPMIHAFHAAVGTVAKLPNHGAKNNTRPTTIWTDSDAGDDDVPRAQLAITIARTPSGINQPLGKSAISSGPTIR